MIKRLIPRLLKKPQIKSFMTFEFLNTAKKNRGFYDLTATVGLGSPRAYGACNSRDMPEGSWPGEHAKVKILIYVLVEAQITTAVISLCSRSSCSAEEFTS